MSQQTVHVPLGKRQYHINFSNFLAIDAENIDAENLRQQLSSFSRVQWVTNTTMAKLYNTWLLNINKGNPPAIVIEDGEAYKNWSSLEHILSQMLNRQLDRKSVLVALGGGVVGDITGLAAALYQRGIAVIQIPTTLLSMVDSSVGGKTAVNHPLGKNMIGAIHQPNSVWIDSNFLTTLPNREYQSGLAEVVKYGLLGDEAFFILLEKNINAIGARDKQILSKLILHSCQMKANIVVADEYEQGQRVLLNLGHTFAHAIENLTDYRLFFHGEAVAIGMVMAAELSKELGYINVNELARIRNLLAKLGLPISWKNPFESAEILQQRMLAAMAHDKKTQSGRLRLILMKKLGAAFICNDAPVDAIGKAISAAAE